MCNIFSFSILKEKKHKKKTMVPTREQFKDFIDAVLKAQEKEDTLEKAFELIWDDDQDQLTPFYTMPLWPAVYKAFNIMFGLEDDKYSGNKLSWWLYMAPQKEAIYTVDKTEHNVSDVDAFYDHLIELASQTKD